MIFFQRQIEAHLQQWSDRPNRKPLLLRGARQVGKSTLIQKMGANFPYFVSLNLERTADARYFGQNKDVKEIWQQILFEKNLPNKPNETLLFIDEIQEIPATIKQLRYFYEDLPDLRVVAASSLLEFSLGDVKSFPVGRIEELTLHPLSFEEFLLALNETAALEALQTVPLPNYAYDKLFRLFKQYVIVGGMPEIVKTYLENQQSVTELRRVYASIWDAYRSDVVKYAKNQTQDSILRHIMAAAPYERDRITFAGFGSSNYRSREVGEAFRALDLAKIIYLIYPTTQTTHPQIADLSRKPRLQFLDTGLLNYASAIQAELLSLEDLNDYYRGFVVGHVVTQELIAKMNLGFYKPLFWVKENAKMNAEVDLSYPFKQLLIPIEVKSGAKGSLRSLHEYMDLAEHDLAVRFLQNKASVETAETRNKKSFRLLNLPYFAASQIDKYLNWAGV